METAAFIKKKKKVFIVKKKAENEILLVFKRSVSRIKKIFFKDMIFKLFP